MDTTNTSFAALPKHRRAVIAIVGLLLVTGACGSASNDAPTPVAAVVTTPPPTAAPMPQPTTTLVVAPAASAPVSVTMPDVRKKNVQVATDELVALGFKVIAHDSSGAGRTVIIKTNWSVTTQDPAPGKKITLPATVDLGGKKFGE